MGHDKTITSYSTRIANTFGALGYISIIIQWAWSLLIVSYPLLASGELSSWISQKTASPSEPTELGAFTPAVTLIAIAITLLVMVTTVIFVARLPKKIGQRGARATHTAAYKLIPVVTGHRPLTKQQRRVLSFQLVLAIKAALVIIPLLALCLTTPIATLTPEMIWVVGAFCATCSTVYFTIQQLIARFRSIPRDAIW